MSLKRHQRPTRCWTRAYTTNPHMINIFESYPPKLSAHKIILIKQILSASYFRRLELAIYNAVTCCNTCGLKRRTQTRGENSESNKRRCSHKHRLTLVFATHVYSATTDELPQVWLTVNHRGCMCRWAGHNMEVYNYHQFMDMGE